MNKRGMFGWSSGVWLDAFLVAIMFWVLIVVLSPFIFDNFNRNDQDEAVQNSFSVLLEAIQRNMLKTDYAYEEIIFSLTNNYGMVGFNSGQDRILRGDGKEIFKPTMCADRACLCLYDDEPEVIKPGSEDRRDHHVMKCKNYQGNIVFLGMLEPAYRDANLRRSAALRSGSNSKRGDIRNIDLHNGDPLNYENLYMHSADGSGIDTRSVLVGTYHVEKVERAGATYILITPDTARMEDHINEFIKCPDSSDGDSDTACDGKPYSSLARENGKYYSCLYEAPRRRCVSKEISTCTDGETSYDACACGSNLLTGAQTCKNGEVYDVICSTITECKDYCDDDNNCDPQLIINCNADPCGKGGCSYAQRRYAADGCR